MTEEKKKKTSEENGHFHFPEQLKESFINTKLWVYSKSSKLQHLRGCRHPTPAISYTNKCCPTFMDREMDTKPSEHPTETAITPNMYSLQNSKKSCHHHPLWQDVY